MLPITGPVNFTTASTFNYTEDGYRYFQKKPYDMRLPYKKRLSNIVKVSGRATPFYSSSLALLYANSVAAQNRTSVLNRAYDRWKDQLGSTASMGVTLAQYGQAVDMIVGRAGQMREFIIALRRADIPRAARALKAPLSPQKRKRLESYAKSKSLSSQILEWNFGWAPTISDIYSSCEILTSEPVFATIKAKYSTNVGYLAPPGGNFSQGHKGLLRVYGQVIADVSVSNPNLRLLNQLGLVNPLTFAYELIPWSFLLGWVSNVEQVLSSYTDLLGLRLSQPMTTFGYSGVHTAFWSGYPWVQDTNVTEMERTNGLYRPTFLFKPLRFSPTRAANAISLLILQMPKR